MSQPLHAAVTEILAMPYFKNEQARSGGAKYGHEEAVALRVKTAGFIQVDKTLFPGITKSMLKRFAKTNDDTELRKVTQGLALGSYILQPAGSQGFPDILVLDFDNVFVCIECKSGQNGLCPMWNDSLPMPETIYVLSSGLRNETTVFLGKDVIGQDTYDLLDKQEGEVAGIVKKYRTLIEKTDSFNRGWIQKSRKQHFQEGGAEKTNYFTHASRWQCELNVLNRALA